MAVLSERKVFIPFLAALIALAWLTLWVWGQSPYGRFLNHGEPSAADFSSGLVLLVVVAGWTVMIIAMMLPTSLPLLALFHRMTFQRPDRVQLVLLLITGYLGIWTLFGAIVLLGDRVLHEVVEQNTWLDTNTWIIGAGILVLAGLYQFTSLKYDCLEKCRSPLSFIIEHWQGRHERFRALRLGVSHGLFCIGCCWSLMLLMFVVGAGNLGWMLALGAVMAIEKNLSWGRRFSAPLGVFLLCCGLALSMKSVLVLP